MSQSRGTHLPASGRCGRPAAHTRSRGPRLRDPELAAARNLRHRLHHMDINSRDINPDIGTGGPRSPLSTSPCDCQRWEVCAGPASSLQVGKLRPRGARQLAGPRSALATSHYDPPRRPAGHRRPPYSRGPGPPRADTCGAASGLQALTCVLGSADEAAGVLVTCKADKSETR